jgi:hypothetical protein
MCVCTGDDATGYFCTQDRDCVHQFNAGTCDLSARRCKGDALKIMFGWDNFESEMCWC